MYVSMEGGMVDTMGHLNVGPLYSLIAIGLIYHVILFWNRSNQVV